MDFLLPGHRGGPPCSWSPDWTRRSLFCAIWDHLLSLCRQQNSRSFLLEGETKHHPHPGRRWECARGDPVTLPSVLPCPLQRCWEGTAPPSPILPLKLLVLCHCLHPPPSVSTEPAAPQVHYPDLLRCCFPRQRHTIPTGCWEL